MFNAPVTGWLVYFAIVATPLAVVLVVNFLLGPKNETFPLASYYGKEPVLCASPYKPFIYVRVYPYCCGDKTATKIVLSPAKIKLVGGSVENYENRAMITLKKRVFLEGGKYQEAVIYANDMEEYKALY